MQDQEENSNESLENEVNVVDTHKDLKDGQTKCPKCGATDISFSQKSGKLRCNFCRYEFEQKLSKTELDYDDITQLKGEIIGSGATNIKDDANNIVTIKCSSCGAEVVIDTSQSTNARCHWCRNVLSINNVVENGAIPDVILPFKITREEAKDKIEKFVGKRKFFAHPIFKKEFEKDNVMGVYLPYMIIDVNCHLNFDGEGEVETRRYTVKHNDTETTYYDADVYEVHRDFDMTIDDLTIESSQDKLNRKNKKKTTNIINSIMPFDTDQCVQWDSNYLRGFSSEKRDVNIEELKKQVNEQVKDIGRIGINKDLTKYDRGIRWDNEDLEIKGRSWKTAYLPVWLYSYQNKKDNTLHYVAVNARTAETMGSIPIYKPKLFAISFLIEIVSLFLSLFIYSGLKEKKLWPFLVLISGFLYYYIKYSKYRNQGARHHHEAETKKQIFNVSKKDQYLRTKNRQRSSTMDGANNTIIRG